MRRHLLRVLATSGMIAGAAFMLPPGPAAAADTCNPDRFCAYQHAGYVLKVLDSGATRGQTVGVADNVVTSAKNRRNNIWLGRDGRGVLPDVTVFRFATQTNVFNVGASANDRIDYFIVD